MRSHFILAICSVPLFAIGTMSYCHAQTPPSSPSESPAAAEMEQYYSHLPPLVLTPLARRIIGSWEGRGGLRHTDTFLADGRYGIDVSTTDEYFGRWRLVGQTLTVYWSANVSTYTEVSATKTELRFVFRGRKFVDDRVK